MSILRRDYLPDDLHAEMRACGVDGAIAVQARQTLDETRKLLDLADRYPFLIGVVGWVPLVSSRLRSDLEEFAGRDRLKAVRHVLQDEPDDDFMFREDFGRGISLLPEFGLRYDILIFERHLPQAIRLVDRNPRVTFILDHVAKPRIREQVLDPWSERLTELARRPNVYCKLSGMVTEADPRNWTVDQLRPYTETALAAFGPRRLMFGSDWPVCLTACGYRRWFETVRDFAAKLSEAERDRLLGGTAIEAYGLRETDES